MPDIPADLRYSPDHLWVRVDAGAGLVRAGVTDFAQQSLGDVVDVSPPGPGDSLTAGEPCGEAEADPAAISQQLAGLLDASAYRALAGG